jgi:hypothetical protein
MKKTIFIAIAFLFFFLPANAQNVPSGMKYQAVARDLSGNVLADKDISLKITLYSFQDRKIQYSEIHPVTTNSLGLFSLTIGEGNVELGTFNKVPWSTEEIWMELAIDESGGNNFISLSDSKLLAVPYAFHAATAGQLAGGTLMGNGDPRDPGHGNGVPSNVWSLFGNSSTDPTEDKLGTTDCADLVIITDNAERIRILCSGEVLIDSDLTVGNDLQVDHNANIDNDLTVQNNVETNITGGNTIVHGNFDVVDGSPTTLTGTLNVNGATDLDNTLNVDGTTDLNSSLDVNNNSPTNLTGTLNVDEETDLNSSLDVNNNSPTNLTGTLNVDEETDLNSSLDVNNNSPTNLTGTLNVDEETDLNSSLDVNNNSPTNLTGTLNVDGVTDINNILNVTSGHTTNLTGILNVDLTTNLSSILNVDGVTNLNNNFNVFNNSPSILTGTLTVDGITNLNSSFNVNNSSPTILTGTLDVDGITNFNNNVTVDDCFQVGTAGSVLLKFNPAIVNSNENSFTNYPLQISGTGASQGVAIKLNSWAPTSNFMAFFATGEMRGRIEGNTGFLVQNFTSVAQNLTDFDPNDADQGEVVVVDTTDQNAGSEADNAGNSAVPSTQVTNSQVNTEELVEFIILAVNFLDAIIQVATSFTSIFDPVDIFEAAVGGVVATADLAVFVGFSVANVGVSYESGSGDYAEWLQKDNVEEMMHYGEVVGVIGGKISKEFVEADKFMIVSASPAVVGAMPPSIEEEKRFEKIAFIGQVPVKVRGEVQIGDYILPSGDGDGLAIAVSREQMRAKDYHRIIGIAWEESKIEDRDKIYQMINTAVGINQNDLATVIDQMQTVMNQMQDAIKEVNPDYQGFVYETESKEVRMEMDYTVSPTHESQIAGYFEGVEYSSREELGLLVKDAIETQAGIDFSEYPVVERMLLDPEYAEAARIHYSNLLDEYLVLMEQLNNQN